VAVCEEKLVGTEDTFHTVGVDHFTFIHYFTLLYFTLLYFTLLYFTFLLSKIESLKSQDTVHINVCTQPVALEAKMKFLKMNFKNVQACQPCALVLSYDVIRRHQN
jgi:hypothetical protein